MTPAGEQVAAADRRIAALSHLGVPFNGLFLPLIIWAASESSPFRRSHARQAFSFQVVFLSIWIVLVAYMGFGGLDPLVLLGVLGFAFVLELPQVVRALVGRPPFRVVPFEPRKARKSAVIGG